MIETWLGADDRLRLAGLLRHVLAGAGASVVAGGVTAAGILAWETDPVRCAGALAALALFALRPA